jgi:hypothetical protein
MNVFRASLSPRRFLIAFIVLAGAAIVWPTTSFAAPRSPGYSSPPMFITNPTGEYLAPPYCMAGANGTGSKVDLYVCESNASNEKWVELEVDCDGFGCAMFRNYYTNLCLDVYQDRDGNKIVQWPCNPGDSAQIWTVHPDLDQGGTPWFNICSYGAGGNLSDPNNSHTLGQQLYEQSVNFEIGQSWDSTLLFSTVSPYVCE